jgi:threonine/homoserine/homoserine lactone efflux protein
VLCIRRTLAEGRATGFVSGLGAATADGIYGSVAAFGLTAVSGALIGQQIWLRLIGGVFLCYLGLRTFIARPAEQTVAAKGRGLLGAYASTLLLTLTNPMTILAFAAIFAGLGLAGASADYASAAALVAGVFAGSAVWWLILSTSAGRLRTRVTPGGLRWVNKISGAIILLFGCAAFLSIVRLR